MVIIYDLILCLNYYRDVGIISLIKIEESFFMFYLVKGSFYFFNKNFLFVIVGNY